MSFIYLLGLSITIFSIMVGYIGFSLHTIKQINNVWVTVTIVGSSIGLEIIFGYLIYLLWV